MKPIRAEDAFIETTTGQTVFPFDPDPETIQIEDIVTSLNRTSRYLGHGRISFTVLAHSYWVAKLVPDEFKLTALMHDATEAYLGDVPSPLKATPIFGQYRAAEENLWGVIARKFGCHEEIPEVVHKADKAMLYHEALAFMPRPLGPWWKKYKVYTTDFETPDNLWHYAENRYLAREMWWQMFDRLTNGKWEKVPW